MTVTRIAWATFGSLVSEDLHGVPGPALTAAEAGLARTPGDPQCQLDACLAALAAGEPKRALRLLDPSHQSPRATAALTGWARQLDDNWYPGGVSAESEEDPAGLYVEPRPGNPTEELLEQLVANGPTGLLNSRTLAERSLREGATLGVQQAFDLAFGHLQDLAAFADSGELPDVGIWTALAAADLCRRVGRDEQAALLLEQGRAAAVRRGDTGRQALSHLVEGDWYATPGSSPDALGWDLAPDQEPSPLPAADPARAAACYDRAEALLTAGAPPRLRAALSLRRAVLLRDTTEFELRREHLEAALTASRDAGDGAGAHLAAVHLLVADIDEGRLGEHTLWLGGGWHPPAQGPVADLLRWAESVGSRSWCVGLGRLLERCGDHWSAGGSAPRARVAYLAALPLISTDPGVPSRVLLTSVADVDMRSNLVTNALLRLERGFGSALADTGDTRPNALAQKLHAALAMLTAHRGRSRGAAALLSADRLARLRDEIALSADRIERELPPADDPVPTSYAELQAARAEMRGDGSLQAQADASRRAVTLMVRSQVGVARKLAGILDVLVPLIRLEVAQAAGQTADAQRWLSAATDAARRPQTSPEFLPLVLATGQRFDEARTVIADTGGLSDRFEFQLWMKARDYESAARTLDRLESSGDTMSAWRDRLQVAQVWLGRGDREMARMTVLEAISSFEDSIRLLLRDPERLDACDEPNVADLYATLARTYLESDGVTAAQADASFEAAERVRTLAAPAGLDGVTPELRLSWQNAAAEYSAVANRLLSELTRAAADAEPGFSALDRLDGRLAELEHAIDTQDRGVLLRRTTPAPPARAADLRRHLADGTVLLEYLAVGDDVLAWAVSRDGIRPVHRTVPGRELTAMVRAHHAGCAAGGAPATRLSALLIDPFADLLRANGRVVVVPFGPLNLVPFHALRLDGAPLALTHVVSYASRAASLLERDGQPDPAAPAARPLVVGDPAFDPAARPGLRRLPGARVEAGAVAAALGVPAGDVLVDEAATEAAVAPRLERCDLLHVSSHGHLDELSPFASALVLAGRDELSVADIAGLRFGTGLAVLTGCDTGRGNATLGGDVVGLTRALLRGGVDRAVVSLWPVDDAVAPVVMSRFYAGLGDGLAPAYALTAAQRAVYAMSAADLDAAYGALGGEPAGERRRRGLDLDPELRDDEDVPEALGGDAERYWAPFIVVD